jgi:hypothetical protein
MELHEDQSNLIFISHLQPHGNVWWMICSDEEIARLATKWIEAYPEITAKTDIYSIFNGAQLRKPKTNTPDWEAQVTFRVWQAVFRDPHPEWKFPIAGPHFHVTDHPGRPSQDEIGDPIEYGCIPCLDRHDYPPYGEDVQERWVSGFCPGEFCSAHWKEWLRKNPIAGDTLR